jgi:hypothetical protein
MKHAEIIIVALAIVLAASGRAIVNLQGERMTQAPVFTSEASETPTPDCPEQEFYNVLMDRCWPIETPASEMTETSLLGADTQTPDAEATAIATYETPAACGWYVPDAPSTPPPTPRYVCSP